jgi:hypothetical protein
LLAQAEGGERRRIDIRLQRGPQNEPETVFLDI